MKYEYAIIVKNKTRLERLIERYNTKAQARFYIERLGGNFEEYEKEDHVFKYALNTLQHQLSKVIKNKIVDRQYLPTYLFAEQHLIIVIGQDGLVANTAKYARAQPIIAVNPDVDRYDGILLPFNITNFLGGVERVLGDRHTTKVMRFAEARLNDGQRLLGFNDLFIGASSHISARYRIRYDGREEDHSSSGIIVSTPAGATGWLSSIFNMAYGVAGLFERDLQPKQPTLSDRELLFAVREPFKSIRTQVGLAAGKITPQQKLTISSYMPNNGIIFSDGIEQDFLQFNSGTIAEIGIAAEVANLVTHE